VRATSDAPFAVPGRASKVNVEVILRRPAELSLTRVVLPDGTKLDGGGALAVQTKKQVTGETAVPADAPVSIPYWLAPSAVPGRNAVSDERLVGEPEGPPALPVVLELAGSGRPLRLEVPLEYVWTDPVEGERVRDVLVAPPATVTPAREAVIFPNGASHVIVVRVRASQDGVEGEVVLPPPTGWRVEPERVHVKMERVGDEATVRFTATPAERRPPRCRRRPRSRSAGAGSPIAKTSSTIRTSRCRSSFSPPRCVWFPASLTLPKAAIGYIEGSGDTVAADLADLGMSVTLLDDETLRSGTSAASARSWSASAPTTRATS
jgi:hypothetical protein